MTKRYLGGIVSAAVPAISTVSSSGLFNITNQMVLKQSGVWPLSRKWDMAYASYTSVGNFGKFNIGTQDTAPTGLFFKPDGTSMYIVGTTNDIVVEYSLSTAWDVTTAVYVRQFSVLTQAGTQSESLSFKTDGTKMYVLSSTNDSVHEYNLTTAWDISSAVSVQSFSVAGQETVPTGLYFSPDGVKMYVTGTTGDDVNEYTLGTAWNVSTAVHIRIYNSAVYETLPTGVFFSSDGTKMYIVGTGIDGITQFSLSTAWNISTAVFVQSFSLDYSALFGGTAIRDVFFNSTGDKLWVIGSTFIQLFNLSEAWNISTARIQTPTNYLNVANQESAVAALCFSSDGTELYILGTLLDSVVQYSLSTAWYINSAMYTRQFSLAAQDVVNNGIRFKPDGKKMFTVGATNDNVYEYSLSVPWNVSTLTYTTSFNVLNVASNPVDVFFRPSGDRMFVLTSDGDAVIEYILSTPWSISTARVKTPLNAVSILNRDTVPEAIFFDPAGIKMYVLGSTGDAVYEYTLSTPWDIYTAVYIQQFSIAAQEITPSGLHFSVDGTKMYVSGATGDDVNEYTLSTPWNVSTAVYVRVFSVATQEVTPEGLFFSPDGTKMYVVGSTGDDINEYTLSTPWNVSTAVYVQLFSVAAQDITPVDLFFKSDGTKMYVLGNTGDDINEYTLSTPWNVSTAVYVQASAFLGFASVNSLFFNSDGTTVYFTQTDTLTSVVSYNLTIPWNISSMVVALDGKFGTFSINAQEITPQGFFFKSDGTKMYVLGSVGVDVTEYLLGTSWDITTATYVREFSVAPLIGPTGIAFNTDGTNMYIADTSDSSLADAIYQYDIG